MQHDTLFIAPLATALFALGAAAAVTLSSPGVAPTPLRSAAQMAPIVVTLPTVVVTGKRETRVAAGEPTPANPVQ